MAGPVADNLPWPAVPDQRYACLALDPPWHFRSRAPSQNPESVRSPQKHYATADINHLRSLPVKQIAAPDAHVFLWITGPLAAMGVHNLLFKQWGVKASSLAFVWIKLVSDFDERELLRTPLLDADLHMGTGFTTRQNAELCFLGRIGSPARRRADIRQVIISRRREHSRKPEEFFKRVEFYCDGPRIDMFSGSAAKREQWDSWGYAHREDEAA